VATLPLEKIRVKQRLFWQKMDTAPRRIDHDGMRKPSPKKRPPRQYAPIYLAEWLAVLDVVPVELVKAGVISEGYLSNLRSGKRLNPSPGKLMQIGAFLQIEWTDLYRSPPSSEAIAGMEPLAGTTVERILKRRRGQ
jgi:transcriptional regulator with XRE-family HTH domain